MYKKLDVQTSAVLYNQERQHLLEFEKNWGFVSWRQLLLCDTIMVLVYNVKRCYMGHKCRHSSEEWVKDMSHEIKPKDPQVYSDGAMEWWKPAGRTIHKIQKAFNHVSPVRISNLILLTSLKCFRLISKQRNVSKWNISFVEFFGSSPCWGNREWSCLEISKGERRV